MSIFTDIRDDAEYPFEQAWEKVRPIFVTDIEPVLKTSLSLFSSQEGKLILTTAIAYAPKLLSGSFGAVVIEMFSVLVEQSIALAEQNTEQTIQQIQSALQLAKVSQNIMTPGDKDIVATVTNNAKTETIATAAQALSDAAAAQAVSQSAQALSDASIAPAAVPTI